MQHSLLGLLSVALIATGCAPSGQRQPERSGIFRQIQISGGVIRLGEQLPETVPAPPPGDSVVSLPARQIGGAEAIRVRLTPDGFVRTLWFDYSSRADYNEMVAEYSTTLGEPRKEPFRMGERAVWQDAHTRFELVHDPERSAGPVYSSLEDLTNVE